MGGEGEARWSWWWWKVIKSSFRTEYGVLVREYCLVPMDNNVPSLSLTQSHYCSLP